LPTKPEDDVGSRSMFSQLLISDGETNETNGFIGDFGDNILTVVDGVNKYLEQSVLETQAALTLFAIKVTLLLMYKLDASIDKTVVVNQEQVGLIFALNFKMNEQLKAA
jgi:hypothetical protein